jgi:hypothetical protein
MRRIRQILLGRLGVVIGIVLAVLAWNAYAAMNDDGILTGVLIGADGRPVADGTITLQRRDVLTTREVATTRTDADGRFTFRDHGGYDLILTAAGPEGGTAHGRIGLLFRNQNHVLEEPMVLQ